MRSDDFVQRKSSRSRRLSDTNGQYSAEKLSKENLEKLSRQANSVKHGQEKRGGEPALLFVEDD